MSSPGTCPACHSSARHFVALRSWAVFAGPLRSGIHRLKYKGDMALGETLARPLISLFESLNWPVDCVVPVPAGARRRAERGYNQAALLAFPLSLACRLPYPSGALTKTRETRSQVGLTLPERRLNVAGAFQARARQTAGKRVLVVDDVTTSGATLDACAAALLAAGAHEVYTLTLARAI
jgi:ComF family protein